MHDFISKTTEQPSETGTGPRRANDCFTDVKHWSPPKLLFDEFWREGELALLFGATGTGKSILATQIADALARGRPIEGLKMEAWRPKVLYVDLVLSDTQFQTRYTHGATQILPGKRHDFSKNLYRERPSSNDKLCEWLRGRVLDESFKVVIIDDIGALRQTHDGTREILKLTRELKKVKDEFKISMLMLAGTREPGRDGLVSESDMQRSRILCDAADSVFALGRHPRSEGNFYIVQTRSRSAAVKWDLNNGPVYSIVQTDNGSLTCKFDKRFVPEIDEAQRELICKIKWRRDAGATYRAVADELGISTTRAFTLSKRWRPDMDPEGMNSPYTDDDEYDEDDLYDEYDEEEEEDDEDGDEDDEPDIGPGSEDRRWETPDAEVDEAGISGESETSEDLSRCESPDDFDPLANLKRSFDANERLILVEREDENGKPLVWYLFDTTGQLSRYEFKGFGANSRHVDGPISLFNTS